MCWVALPIVPNQNCFTISWQRPDWKQFRFKPCLGYGWTDGKTLCWITSCCLLRSRFMRLGDPPPPNKSHRGGSGVYKIGLVERGVWKDHLKFWPATVNCFNWLDFSSCEIVFFDNTVQCVPSCLIKFIGSQKCWKSFSFRHKKCFNIFDFNWPWTNNFCHKNEIFKTISPTKSTFWVSVAIRRRLWRSFSVPKLK